MERSGRAVAQTASTIRVIAHCRYLTASYVAITKMERAVSIAVFVAIVVISFAETVLPLTMLVTRPDFLQRNSCMKHINVFHTSKFAQYYRPSGKSLFASAYRQTQNTNTPQLAASKRDDTMEALSSTQSDLSFAALDSSANSQLLYRIPNDAVYPRLVGADRIILSSALKGAVSYDSIITTTINVNTTTIGSHNLTEVATSSQSSSRLDKLQDMVQSNFNKAAETGIFVGSSIQQAFSKTLSPLRHLEVNWTKLADRGITPILVFVNKKSGGQQGQRALDNLRRDLHHIQVCDLTTNRPADYLELFKNALGDVTVLVCGGDGSVGWIMDEVNNSGLAVNRTIRYAIVPFGTGNDLFRHVVNFAHNATADVSPSALVANCTRVLDIYHRSMQNTMSLDRWSMDKITRKRKLLGNITAAAKQTLRRGFNKITRRLPSSRAETATAVDLLAGVAPNANTTTQLDNNSTNNMRILGRIPRSQLLYVKQKATYAFDRIKSRLSLRKLKSLRKLQQQQQQHVQDKQKLEVFNNYFGVGVDGAVSIAFDEMRRQMPRMFFHKLVNKAWYAVMGLFTFLFREYKDLSKYATLHCDGRTCPIPPGTGGLIFTNINSYAGGSKLWQFEDIYPWRQQDAGDGMIEVVAVTGLPHLGKIKTGLAKAMPLAQGRRIEFTSTTELAMQLDGEPWRQQACNITLSSKDRVRIIVPLAPPEELQEIID